MSEMFKTMALIVFTLGVIGSAVIWYSLGFWFFFIGLVSTFLSGVIYYGIGQIMENQESTHKVCEIMLKNQRALKDRLKEIEKSRV